MAQSIDVSTLQGQIVAPQSTESPEAFVQEMVYSPKAQLVDSESYKYEVQSDKQYYNSSDVARIFVGTCQNLLDPKRTYLRFTVENNDDGATNPVDVALAGQAPCCIQRLEEQLMGQVVCQIDHYGALYNALLDLETSPDERAHMLDILEGSGAGAAVSSNNNADSDIDQIVRSGTVVPAGENRTFCVPLMSPLLGTHNEKWVPLLLLRDNIELRIHWASKSQAFAGAQNTNASPTRTPEDASLRITNVELSAHLVKMDQQIENQYKAQFANRPLVIPTTSFATSSKIVEDTSAFQSIIGERRASMRAIYTMFRNTANMNDGTSNGIQNREDPLNGSNAQIQYQIGSRYVPSLPLRDSPQAFAELMKARHNLTKYKVGTCLNYDDFTKYNTSQETAGSGLGSSLCAVDLQSAGERNNDLISGSSSLGDYMFVNYRAGETLGTSLEVTSFVEYDMRIVVDSMSGNVQIQQ